MKSPGRLLEIGNFSLLKRVYPRETTLVWAGCGEAPAGLGHDASSVRVLGDRLAAGEFDGVFCHPPLVDLWPAGERVASRLRRAPRRIWQARHARKMRLLLQAGRTPVIVLDLSDEAVFARQHLWLLDRCTHYFKRELPADIAEARADAAFRRVEGAEAALERNAHKLRTISLGLSAERLAHMPADGTPKTVDLFFAGTAGRSRARLEGLKQLAALERRGYRIDIPTERLGLSDYLDRCGRAWLVWSPEGLGWDCFRHYEAAAAGAVPVINHPTIRPHRPLRHGEHCFYYDTAGDGLVTTVVEALRRPDELRSMARAAREHVLTHHTHRAICEYILATVARGAEPFGR